MKLLSIKYSLLIFLCFALIPCLSAQSEQAKKEAAYYKIVDVPIPDDVVLEVGGLALNDQDQLGVCTRRGEVWLLDQPYGKSPKYQLYAKGLHEPLGLAFKNNGFYATQRGELTRLEDRNQDGKADLFKTIYSWPLSGNYHDYSYGPKFLPNGDMVVTLNLSWIGYGESLSKWRGWLLQITPDGKMTPVATGLRSPAGFVVNEKGDVFYTENQGDWVGSGRMTHLEKGDFAGNPGGLNWIKEQGSPLALERSSIPDDPGMSLYEYAQKVPEVKAPAVWFPHTILGISTSDVLIDDRAGKFGPFSGQWLIGDQGHSKIMRVAMEEIEGVYQGAAFNFVEGFSSGILRMVWGSDNSMFVGMTSRGWASTGKKMFGLQRLVWNGKTPFEMKTIKAQNDGFIVEFTKPVNAKTGSDPASYEMTTFTYKYHKKYGSPIVDQQDASITKVELAEDGLSAKLTIDGMRLGFIHQLVAAGVRSRSGEDLLHNTGYYTLNAVPGGELKSQSLNEDGAMADAAGSIKRLSKMPESWTDGPDEELSLGTVPGLKYDETMLYVKPSAKVKLTFNNNDDMLHNLVIVKKGDAIEKVTQLSLDLGLKGEEMNYVPDSDLILFHTGILQPESSETIYFEAPSEPGYYQYVCTFPGHAQIMRGTLVVEE
ncbi:MAG: plastocyanin/azurin family copper-binding protein [Bacteroidota bacterium]